MKKLFATLKLLATKLLFIPPVVAGVAVLVFAIQNRKGAETLDVSEIARTLRVITVEQMVVRPRAIGYGTSRPLRLWKAIAEVKGRVVEIHADLKSGSFISEGDLLVRLDETDTQLAISRLNAEIAKVDSNIAELRAKKENYEASVQLEREALLVAEKELARLNGLVQSNAIAKAEIDSEEQAVLAQRQKVQSIVSSINLLPSQVQAANASLASAKASLAEKNRDLERIQLHAPFDCRIGPVDLELNQFVAAGEMLFEAHSIDSVEIEAQVSVKNMRMLFDEERRKQDLRDGLLELDQEAVKRYLDIEAVVGYAAGGRRAERIAEFERIREQLDLQTRSVGVVVSIKNPFSGIENGPPPVSGTYCEVELIGKARSNQVVIPRSAIRRGFAYVLDNENRLRRHQVVTSMTQSEFAVVESGVEVGDTLVVSDPTPAVEGMLVEPVNDDSLLEQLRMEAGGPGMLK